MTTLPKPSAFVLLLALILRPPGPVSASPICLTPAQIACLLNKDEGKCAAEDSNMLDLYRNDTRQILIGRLRFPGTASTHEYEMFKKYEETKSRYEGLGVANGCDGEKESRLCFDVDEQNPDDASRGQSGASDDANDVSLALSRLYQTGWGSHEAYDLIEHSMDYSLSHDPNHVKYFPEPFMITTLRGVGSYAHKWYAYRRTWDRVVDLGNATFEEWIDLAPWRHNVLTRMLGAKDDRLAMPKNLLYTREGELGDGLYSQAHLDQFVKDEYMTEQNGLRSPMGESEVFKLALARLEATVHFSLFHRLSESWKLMAHTFCWDMGYEQYRPDKEITGLDAIRNYVVKKIGGTEEEAARIWDMLKDRNRLDVMLMQEAERIFDNRLERMKRDKADGVVCNFFGRVKVTCSSSEETWDEKVR